MPLISVSNFPWGMSHAGAAAHVQDPKDAMLREFQDEIKRLRQLLEVRSGGQCG